MKNTKFMLSTLALSIIASQASANVAMSEQDLEANAHIKAGQLKVAQKAVRNSNSFAHWMNEKKQERLDQTDRLIVTYKNKPDFKIFSQ